MIKKQIEKLVVVTAGSNYLDIDAYACMVAMAELLQLKGVNSIAYSPAPYNYSVCDALTVGQKIVQELPLNISEKNTEYIIVDVSDPDFLKNSVPIERVIEVYDHHVGFEKYWTDRIGNGAHIEFIGAAATLIYREWKCANLQDKISKQTALLLIAAILDNTLNLTSANTTAEDRAAFCEMCEHAGVEENFCVTYFSEVQKNIESDLKNALFNDIKIIRNNSVLPSRMAQLCIWNADKIFSKLSEIRRFFDDTSDSWMINIIDLEHQCSYFVCDDIYYQKTIESFFDVCFESGVAKSSVPYLRKEIIKKTMN